MNIGSPPQTDHTALTVRNFAGFAQMMAVIGFATVGIGAVDLIMVVPKGAMHVAAVGLGDLVVVAGFAFFGGIIDVYAGRLATAEGAGTTSTRLPVLVTALLGLAVTCGVVTAALSFLVGPGLRAAHQDPAIISLVGDYIDMRLYGAAAFVVYAAIGATMRLLGAKLAATAVLSGGFIANIALNYVFLYTSLSHSFSSPESAVAASTVALQVALSPVGLVIIVRQLRRRGLVLRRPSWSQTAAEYRSMVPAACGFGGRLVNDYLSAIVPIFFIGTMGAGWVAATAVATKIYTLYCRIPQACFEASFALYGYAFGRAPDSLVPVVRRLIRYSAVPTAAAWVLVVAFSPLLVRAFGGTTIDHHRALVMLAAYMATIPPYFFDQFYSRLLTVHQRGRVLLASSFLTWIITIPLAWIAVFEFTAPFLAIVTRGVVSGIVAGIFQATLRRRCWPTGEKQRRDAGDSSFVPA